jgi:hypothetical protein
MAAAVRDGNAVFTGLPKTPAWTNLNATADVGATTITINGVANWAVGDRIVIASSRYSNSTGSALHCLRIAPPPGCARGAERVAAMNLPGCP